MTDNSKRLELQIPSPETSYPITVPFCMCYGGGAVLSGYEIATLALLARDDNQRKATSR